MIAECIAVPFLGIQIYSFSMGLLHPERFSGYGAFHHMFFASLGIVLILFYMYVIYYVVFRCLSLLKTHQKSVVENKHLRCL